MYRGTSCPPEHEVSDRQEDDADKSWHKAMLRRSQTVLFDVWDQVLELVRQEAGDADHASDANGDEAQAGLS